MTAAKSEAVTLDCVNKGGDADEDDGTTKMGCRGKDGTNEAGRKDDETKALGDVVDNLGGEKEDETVARYSSWH